MNTRPTPLTFPIKTWGTWEDAFEHVLAACRDAEITLPMENGKPILWRARMSEWTKEQEDCFVRILAARVEMEINAEELEHHDNLAIVANALDYFLRSTRNRASRGSDLSDLEPAALEVAHWLAARREFDDEVPKPESVLDIVTGGGKRVHEALDEDWDPDLLAALTRYRDACHLIDLVNARWRSLRDRRHETTPRPLSGSLFSEKPEKP